MFLIVNMYTIYLIEQSVNEPILSAIVMGISFSSSSHLHQHNTFPSDQFLSSLSLSSASSKPSYFGNSHPYCVSHMKYFAIISNLNVAKICTIT